MSNPKLTITINADTAGATKPMKDIGGTIDAVAKKTAVAGLAMTGAGMAVSAVMSKATKTAADYGSQVALVQRMTGASAEESSKWAAVLNRYGIEGKKSALVFKSLSSAIATNSEGLQQLGISTKNMDGTNRSTMEVFGDLAERYKNAKDKSQVLTVATKTLGRGFSDLLPVLAAGKQGIEDIADAAERNGMILSDADLRAAKQYSKALKDNEQAMFGLQVQVGKSTLPFETLKTQAIGGAIQKLNEVNPELVSTGGALTNVAAQAGAAAGKLLTAGAAMMYLGKNASGALLKLAPAGAIALGTSLEMMLGAIDRAQAKNLGGMIEKLGVSTKAANTLGTALIGLRTPADAAGMTLNWAFEGFTKSLPEGIKWLTGTKSATDAATASTAIAATVTGRDAAANQDLAASLRGVKDARNKARSAANAQVDTELAMLQAQDGVKEAQREYNATLKEHGRRSHETREAELKLSVARREAKAATWEYRKAVDAAKDAQERERRASERAKVATDRLKVSISKLPGKKLIDVRANTKEAIEHVKALQGWIKGIPDSKTVDFYTRNHMTGSLAASTIGKHAAGGVFSRATLGIIGEAGTEVLINRDRLRRGDSRQVGLTRELLAGLPIGRQAAPAVTVAFTGPIRIEKDVDIDKLAMRLADAAGARLRASGY